MTNETILVVDDEPDIRDIVSEILSDENYQVYSAENAQMARDLMRQHPVDLVLLDIWMPDIDGISLLKEWLEEDSKDLSVVMISGHGTVETAVEAIRYGAFDFLEKPLSTAKLLVTVQRALQDRKLRLENKSLRERVMPVNYLVGKSSAMQNLRDQIERIGASDSWIMITGEPGSGKEVVARALHEASARREKPFVDVNLAAGASENVSRLLFGSEESGTTHPGCFERARGGTLLLDEIGDLNSSVQTQLVNALDEQRFIRVGGNQPVEIDVRIISATNKNLEQSVADGEFREDLYYRLNVIPIRVPPLREHIDDIAELIDFYTNRMVEHEGLTYHRFSTAAINRLRNHNWPGNVRELTNLIQRLLIVCQHEEISSEDVESTLGISTVRTDGDISESEFDTSLREARDRFEKAYLTFHLKKLKGNMSELAQVVGMERTHLYRKIKSLGINPKDHKSP